ncbi:MAG: RnfH family protein [Lautropia mirabilis]|nr:RnfH family protein [Lautropia mirabilis]
MVELVIQYPETAAPEATRPEAINPEATIPEAANPEEVAQPVRYALVRTLHRVPPGTTIRQLLQRAAAASALQTPLVPGTSPAAQHSIPRVDDDARLERACPGGDEPCNLVQAIEAKALGLSRFGRRAWLDDPLRPDDRVEVLRPILADAKAARFARVAKSRAERTDGRWGRRSEAGRQIRATMRRGAG